MLPNRLGTLMVIALNIVLSANTESGRFNTNTKIGRNEEPQSKNKYVQNVLFANKLWLTAEQLKKLNDLYVRGDNPGVIRELEAFYRNLNDKTRASLRIQSTCRAILSKEIGQSTVEELITMKTKLASSSEFVNKINSLFQDVKNSDIIVIQPLCIAAYEGSHVPTANDPRLRRNAEEAAMAA